MQAPEASNEIVGMDYDMKLKALEQAHQDLLTVQEEFVSVSGRYAELKALITLIKTRISALQTALKAEGMR